MVHSAVCADGVMTCLGTILFIVGVWIVTGAILYTVIELT
jgi:hypothetical protein